MKNNAKAVVPQIVTDEQQEENELKDNDEQSVISVSTGSQLSCEKVLLTPLAVVIAAIPGLANVPAAYAVGSQTSRALGIFYTIPPAISNWPLNLHFIRDLKNDIQLARNANAGRGKIIFAHSVYFTCGFAAALPISALALVGGGTSLTITLFVFTQSMTAIQYKFSIKIIAEALLRKLGSNVDVDNALINSQIENFINQCDTLSEKIIQESQQINTTQESVISLEDLFHKRDQQVLNTKIKQVSRRSESVIINYILPTIGTVCIDATLIGFIPFMYENLVDGVNFSPAGAKTISVLTLGPLFTLLNYFTFNNYKLIPVSLLHYYQQKNSADSNSAVSNPDAKEQSERYIKYISWGVYMGAILAPLSFAPVEFLLKEYIFPHLSQTAQSIVSPIFFPVAVIGIGGFMITGYIQLFQHYKQKFMTDYAAQYGSAQEYMDMVVIPGLVSFFETHPDNFSSEDVKKFIQETFNQLHSNMKTIADGENNEQKEIDFTQFKRKLQGQFVDNRKKLGFFQSRQEKKSEGSSHDTELFNNVEDSLGSVSNVSEQVSPPKRRGCLDMCLVM